MYTVLTKAGGTYFSMIWQLINLIVIFTIVLFLAYFATKVFAGAKIKTMKNNNMKIIESISIGFNNLHILKINEKYYLISSSKEGIRYLTELDKDELNIIEQDLPLTTFEESFKSYIEKLRTKGKTGDKDEK